MRRGELDGAKKKEMEALYHVKQKSHSVVDNTRLAWITLYIKKSMFEKRRIEFRGEAFF